MLRKRGTVTSAKMTGTVTVTVHRQVYHALYKKQYRMSKKFLADPGEFTVREGDEVEITECRPLSKNKRFRVTEVVKQAAQVSELVEEAGLTGVMQRKKPESSSSSS